MCFLKGDAAGNETREREGGMLKEIKRNSQRDEAERWLTEAKEQTLWSDCKVGWRRERAR